MRVWFQFVATKANVADLPSRGAMAELREVLSSFEDCVVEGDRQMVIPPFDAWDAPFSLWMEHVAEAAASSSEGGGTQPTKRHRRR